MGVIARMRLCENCTRSVPSSPQFTSRRRSMLVSPVSQQAQAQQQQQLPSSAHRQWGSRQNLTAALCHSRRRTPRSIRTPAASPVAMVNVDFSPSLLLGIGMIGGGLALYQVRLSKPWISRDYDVVISSVAILTGGILIFQGWRLDPLLLFGQLLTAGTATAFAVESLRLRDIISEERPEEEEVVRMNRDQRSPQQQQWNLPPPPPESADYTQWSGAADYTERGRWQPTEPAADYQQPEGDAGSQWAGREDSYYNDQQDRQYPSSPVDQRYPAQYDDRQGPVSGEPYDKDDDNDDSGTPTTWGTAANYESVEDW